MKQRSFILEMYPLLFFSYTCLDYSLKPGKHCKLLNSQLLNNMVNQMFFVNKKVYYLDQGISSCVHMQTYVRESTLITESFAW